MQALSVEWKKTMVRLRVYAGFECLMEENNDKTKSLHAGFECLMEENNGKTKSLHAGFECLMEGNNGKSLHHMQALSV